MAGDRSQHVKAMHSHLRASLTVTCALLLLAACSKSNEPAAPTPPKSPAPANYSIDLSPAIKVGQKFSYTADLAQTQNFDISITGLPAAPGGPQGKKFTAHLEGEAEVLAVNPKGGVQKVAFTVKSLTAMDGDKLVPGLPTAGARIVGERKGKDTTITIDGKPATDEISSAIGDTLPLDDDLHTDQELSGPTKPVSVGDTWPVNASAMVDEFKQQMDTELSDVKGTMKLDAVKGSGADQVANVSGGFSATAKPSDLPRFVTVDTSTATGTMSGAFPATATKGTLTEAETLVMKVEAHGEQQGMATKINVTSEQKRSASATYHP
jgi:hypothetical protein